MNSNIAFVVIPLLALVIAALSAAGIWYWWISAKEGDEGDEPPSEDEDPLFKLPRLDLLRREAAPPSPATPMENVVEVMRVYRDLADGSLIIDVAGRQYRHVGEIDDPSVARRLVGNVQALMALAGLSDAGGGMLTPPAMPQAAPLPQAAPPPASPTPLPSALRRSAAEEPSEPVKRGIFGQRKEKKPPEPEPLSMIEQIEELLQFRLAMTPALARRNIHISEAAAGGVAVEVDGMVYAGVGEVPDDEVRNFIQATIQEWEARH